MTEWRNRIIGLEWKPANQLLANSKNPRRHPARQRESIKGMLDNIGWIDVIIENQRTGEMLDGHARVEEALTIDENMPLPVLLVDIDESEQDIVVGFLDWITQQATYDSDGLQSLLHDIEHNDKWQSILSSGDNRLQTLFDDIEKLTKKSSKDKGSQIANADIEKWQVQLGDIWQAGKHRILCGDCFDCESITGFLCGETPALLFADPPYDFTDGNALAQMIAAHSSNTHIFIMHSDSALVDYLRHSTLHFHGFFIYDYVFSQPRANMPYQNHILMAHEIAGSPKKYEIINDGFATIQRVKYRGTLQEERIHAHQKSIESMRKLLEHYTDRGQLIYDPFAGSGTTIVVAEQLQRRCFAVELEPSFVAAILERLSQIGLVPERLVLD